MAAVASQHRHESTVPSRSPSVTNGLIGSHTKNHGSPSHIPNEGAPSETMAPAALQPGGAMSSNSKKGKSKKAADPSETSKLLAAKISQLEMDKAGEKDQEAEIEREVKKANRDLSNLLSTIESPLSRLETVQKKYTELLTDMRKLDRDHVKNKKRADQLQKEKDHGRSELSKAVGMKEKLEKLCRELQKENKKLKEEHKKLDEVEKTNREELSVKFGDLILDVRDLAGQKEDLANHKMNIQTDELFRQKFKSFIDQYELREIHFHSMLRTKELEVQFNMARYEQQRKFAEQESTRSRALSAQVSTFSQTESELRSQLNIYVEKFKQVEDTLNNSNDLFLTFRKEMEEMSKKTKRLEKENMNLTRKHDLTNRNIIEMAEERTQINKEMEALRKKNANLEKLCRGMQAQGRAGPALAQLDGEDEGTESDYEYDDDEEDEEGSEDEGEYDDDDTEEEVFRNVPAAAQTYGPVPPPPPPPLPTPPQDLTNGRAIREVNEIRH